jgi:hypothetical protein
MKGIQIAAKVTAGISALLAVTMTLYVVLTPDFYVTYSEIVVETLNGDLDRVSKIGTSSYLQVNGLYGLIPLAIPIMLSLFGYWTLFWVTKSRLIIIWTIAILLLLFSFLFIFSIGLGYVPSGIAMILAAIFETFHFCKAR